MMMHEYKHNSKCDLDPYTFEWLERCDDGRQMVFVCRRCQAAMETACQRLSEVTPLIKNKPRHLSVIK